MTPVPLFLSVFHPFQGHALLEALEASRSEQLPSTPVVSWPRLSEPPPGFKMHDGWVLVDPKMGALPRLLQQNGGKWRDNADQLSFTIRIRGGFPTKMSNKIWFKHVQAIYQWLGLKSCRKPWLLSPKYRCIQTEFYHMLFILPPNIELGSPLCHWGAVPLSQWGD